MDIFKTYTNEIKKIGCGKRILFATVPADGHVNPLTGLAVHLKSIGYDVRWYTSNYYADKIAKLNIPHYPLIKAVDVRGDEIEVLFSEREKHESQVAKLNFDIINVFIERSTEYFEDLQEIYKTFRFDLLIADFAFTAIPFVREKMNIPVIAAGIVPLMQTSKDLPPPGLGMTPAYSLMGQVRQAALRFLADKVLFKKSISVLKELCAKNGLTYNGENTFDYLLNRSTLVFQSGTPGFEYYRSDLGENVRFVGPLLPSATVRQQKLWFDERLNQYNKVILVTQGTVEKDVEKLLVPTLEAFKNTDVLVVVTTGGSCTAELRKRYPHPNIIVEDFIPFGDVMPYADVYVTNGGYGGVLLAIEHQLPLVVGGVHEGKNEINARVGYFKLGVNMQTETPQVQQVKRAVTEVLKNPVYKINVVNLAEEFNDYDSNKICAKYISEVLQLTGKTVAIVEEELLF
jgi:MGT family glycosyltransferase